MNLAQKLASSPAISTAQATEYDYYIVIDQSGSMGEPSEKTAGQNRWQEAEEFTLGFARFADTVDSDGITVITFNDSVKMFDNVKADKVKEIFATQRPSGGTELTPALEAIFKKKFAGTKKAIAVIVTDGRPTDEAAVARSIIGAANRLNFDEEMALQFVQIGSDPNAAKFLTKLDDDLQKSGAKFDIVNSLTMKEAGSISPEQLLYQALND